MTQESNLFDKIKLIDLFAKPILPFDGNQANLARFINHCEKFYTKFKTTEVLLNEVIIDIIKSKLTGTASEVVSSNERITQTWNDLKIFLKLRFEEKISLSVLFWDLQNAQRLRHEDDLEFLEKIVELKNKYDSQIELSELPVLEKEQEKNIASRVATRVLLYNINAELRTALRGRHIMNYDEMVTFIRQDYYYYQQPFSHYKTQMNRRQSEPQRNIPQNNQRNFNQNNQRNVPQNVYRNSSYNNTRNFPTNNRYQNYQRNYRENPFNQSFQQRFPSQPIQFQQRAVNTYYPTNRQVFGPSTSREQNVNVFKPDPNRRIQTPPEKMSIQTRNYPQKRQNYSTQYQTNPNKKYFSSEQSPNFTFEELTHIQSTSQDPRFNHKLVPENERDLHLKENFRKLALNDSLT